jgi:hypothetical protein
MKLIIKDKKDLSKEPVIHDSRNKAIPKCNNFKEYLNITRQKDNTAKK